MRKRLYSLLCLLGFLLPCSLWAQVSVTGTVTDASRTPLSGVSVSLRNTAIGTTTDANGKFSLTIPERTGFIEVSHLGYLTQSFEAANISGDLNIVLQEAIIDRMEEVVVTGFASSVKRSNLGNAVSTISSKQLTGITVQPTLDAALYGKFTGSNISAN